MYFPQVACVLLSFGPLLLSERAAIEFLGNLERRDTRTQT